MKIGIVLFFSLNVLGQNFDLTDLFERATIDPLSCDSLLYYCTQTTNNQNTAYLAAGFMIKAKHLSSYQKQSIKNLINEYCD